MLTEVRIHNVVELGQGIVWYVHGYECVGRTFWFCLHGPSYDGSSRSRSNRLC